MVFQLYHTYYLVIFQNGAIGFLGVRLVFLLCNEIVAWGGIQGIAQHLDKQFAKKSLLELLFFRLLDILLDLSIKKICLIFSPCLSGLLFIKQTQVFLDDILLKQHRS